MLFDCFTVFEATKTLVICCDFFLFEKNSGLKCIVIFMFEITLLFALWLEDYLVYTCCVEQFALLCVFLLSFFFEFINEQTHLFVFKKKNILYIFIILLLIFAMLFLKKISYLH
ncbi:hypothetical protein RFI_14773 [Reticulomyxa filosa]|uniref:Uncharacterized protein n=1 Tax=Reticulomyxa filosa TaxID=46433 RepID=X6N834_RETFI|nr:hypothetical protein RFI_14773 [Reticulomyxa filosa]|eukprot:ETO22430.1 hypothetical protein RFI_14773 [Reticulomyxa filosa]